MGLEENQEMFEKDRAVANFLVKRMIAENEADS